MTELRPRPVPTVLDALRARVDPARFDVAVLGLETVAADLGYGDVRALPGTIAWIDGLRAQGKRTAVAFGGDSAPTALRLAGVADRFDAVEAGPRTAEALTAALADLGVPAGRAVVVDATPEGIAAARAAGAQLAVAVARGLGTPEQLRRAGADAVVADLQELLA